MAKNDLGYTIPDGVASDIVIFTEKGEKVLLVERKNEPIGYALPGGFLDPNETLAACAVRELKEETGITLTENQMTLIGVYSEPKRDPRARIISAAYGCAVDLAAIKDAVAGDDAHALQVVSVVSVLTGEVKTVFDHKLIIKDAVEKLFQQ